MGSNMSKRSPGTEGSECTKLKVIGTQQLQATTGIAACKQDRLTAAIYVTGVLRIQKADNLAQK